MNTNNGSVNRLSAKEIVSRDLNYICNALEKEFQKMAGKHLLITGGAGFLGYYLIRSVLHWNDTNRDEVPVRVTVYDNYMRGIPGWLDAIGKNEQVELIRHDIIHPLPEDISDFDYIIHAASIASPIFYRKYPLETIDANVNGLRHLLDYARRQKEKGKPPEGFLYFSTSEIYGDPDTTHIPTPETYRGNVSSTGPRACYDESKRFGETLCTTFAMKYDLPVTMVRPFNNYGPGLKITDRRVIPDFMRDVLDGKDIVMYSDGSPSRTFCYIADAITGYFKVLINGKKGEAYNIGTDKPEVTMKELAQKITDIAKVRLNYSGSVIHEENSDSDYLTDNPNRRCPVIKKARRDLGYEPRISLEKGLTHSLLWYNENREAVEA